MRKMSCVTMLGIAMVKAAETYTAPPGSASSQIAPLNGSAGAAPVQVPHTYISLLKGMFPDAEHRHRATQLINWTGKLESNGKNIPQHPAGPGRGHFQFELPTVRDDGKINEPLRTAAQRLYNVLKARGELDRYPAWAEKVRSRQITNAMELGLDEQRMLTLANYYQGKAPFRGYVDGTADVSPFELWRRGHWGGTSQDVLAKTLQRAHDLNQDYNYNLPALAAGEEKR